MSRVNHRRKGKRPSRLPKLPNGGRRSCTCHPPVGSKQHMYANRDKKVHRERRERRKNAQMMPEVCDVDE